MEQKKQRAQALIFGSIKDAGQLSLALLINELASESGWLMVTGKELYRLARLSERAGRNKLNQLVEMGVVEWQKKPPQGLRLKTDDRHQVPLDRHQVPLDRQEMPLQLEQDHRHQMPLERQEMPLDRHDVPLPNAPAYLPKRYKDKKEEEEKDSSSSSPGTELMVVDGNQAPDTPCPNQPAAQPPAVVEQGAQLPVKPKAKRKTPRKNPPHRIPEGWEPKAETLAGLASKQGIPREFCEALIWEFRIYWTDRGDARPGWDATFVRHAKEQWKREQDNEQRTQANQKYRDASGRPISEREYVARQNTKQVLADLESGILDGIGLDTKF